MSDLSAFLPELDDQEATDDLRDARLGLDLLVLDHGDEVFGVLASHVAGVIAYRPPGRVPSAGRLVAGVLQDRGRIVAVLRHPMGLERAGDVKPTRVALCRTDHGLLGLPCTGTRSIEHIRVERPPAHGDVMDVSAGLICFVDVPLLATKAREHAG